MLVAGSNSFNQLNIKDFTSGKYDNISKPTKCQINPEELNSFSTYYSHSVWVTKKGVAYGIGDNSRHQIDPFLKKTVFEDPVQIKFIDEYYSNQKIISAVCGETYTLYFTKGVDPKTKKKSSFLHFVNNNFEPGQEPFTFPDEDLFLFGGNSYAAIITSSESRLFIFSGDPVKIEEPLENKPIIDVALCETFVIVITDEYDIIALPTGNSSFKKTRYKKITEKYNVHTISGTFNIAVAIASEKDNSENYVLIIFNMPSQNKHPVKYYVKLDYFVEQNIKFKYVSCAKDFFLLLTPDGKVYSYKGSIDDLKNDEAANLIQNIQNIPATKFIIAGRDSQVFITSKAISDRMTNYHASEEFKDEEEEEEKEKEEEEEEEEESFTERENILFVNQLENQRNITQNEILRLYNEKLSFSLPLDLHQLYVKNSSINGASYHSKIFKMKLNYSIEEENEIFYAMKIFNNIHIADYLDYISKCKILYNPEYYHPLIVRIIKYNYDINNLRNIAPKRLNKTINQNRDKFRNGEEEEEEEEAEIECQHNFDIEINTMKNQDDFYYPLVILPYFPQNLFDKISSSNVSNSIKVLWIAEILTAVSHLHKLGICHERLTPWNILISNSNDAFISDVFSSEFVERDQTVLLKDEKALWFIDPEILNSDILNYQVDNTLKQNHDIYSIGKLMFYIISGSFESSNTNGNIYQKLYLQYSNSEINNSNKTTSTESVEDIDFPSIFQENAISLINSCISFSKEGRPQASSILEYLKSIDFQLLPKVSKRIIENRLNAIDELTKKRPNNENI